MNLDAIFVVVCTVQKRKRRLSDHFSDATIGLPADISVLTFVDPLPERTQYLKRVTEIPKQYVMLILILPKLSEGQAICYSHLSACR